jgi:hypothetical protein
MSSDNTTPTTIASPTFHCAAGVNCELPHVDYAHRPHKCFLCKKPLHGVCGLLHDADDITYQNHCYYSCNHNFFGPIRTTPPEPDSAVAHSIMKLSANPTSDALVAPQISTSLPDSIGRLLMHSSGTSIPVFLIQEPQCQPFWKVRV